MLNALQLWLRPHLGYDRCIIKGCLCEFHNDHSLDLKKIKQTEIVKFSDFFIVHYHISYIWYTVVHI